MAEKETLDMVDNDIQETASSDTLNPGGGSGGTPQTNGGTGGSGVVILAMPTPGYPGTATGAIVTTPPAAPGFTVLTYNTPNPTTPGSFTFTT